MNKEIEYRIFDELLSAVLTDLKRFDQEGLINPQDLIKEAQAVNRELGVRIQPNKETIVSVQKGRVKLPNNYYLINFALACGEYEVVTPIIQGIQTEDIMLNAQQAPQHLPDLICTSRDCNNPCAVRLTECGDKFEVIQTFKTEVRKYKYLIPLHLEADSISPECAHFFGGTHHRKAQIKQKWLYTPFDCGDVYINYVGNMEDDDNNLLVIDDPIINEYYEYRLKVRVLEILLTEGEQVADLYKLFDAKRRNARLEAHAIVFGAGYEEIRNIWLANRRAMYAKYYKMFEDC